MRLLRLFSWLFWFAVTGVAAAGVVALFVAGHFSRGLPAHDWLATYEPPVATRVHAGDGRLLAEFAVEHRLFVPVEAIPKRVVDAFLAAEDKNFYSHAGLDPAGLLRAVYTNVRSRLSNAARRPVGGSTITQQVAKNFLLSAEVSFERKIKEAILALRLEKALPKDAILELYLNQIYLGYGSYGVAAAALNYFNRSLDELAIAEAAFLAALPKAPNNYHPVRRRAQALARRNWVVGRMLEDDRISSTEATDAVAAPLETRSRDATEFFEADWFAEEVRRELIEVFGQEKLYSGGLSVRTTIDPALQRIGERALRTGLQDYDRRHGWRGPLAQLDRGDLAAALAATPRPPALGSYRLAAVTDVSVEVADILLADGETGRISLAEAQWARRALQNGRVGAEPQRMDRVLKVGDLVAVEPAGSGGLWALRQIPEVEGGLIAMDPHTGHVLAMVGGYDAGRSEFNRATQAMRQPGSAFKPFVYLAALQKGYTPTTLLADMPIVIDQGSGLGFWRPRNYDGSFHGVVPMRIGIEKSRNLMTARLAQAVGMGEVAALAARFGIHDDMPEVLSMSLGAGETTLTRMTAAYAMLANGGRLIAPTLIDRVQDRHGRTVFRHERRVCAGCGALEELGPEVPYPPDLRERIADAQSVYQMVSMLEGVVLRGTGRRLQAVGKPLAGKTGTTNDYVDAWFVGFASDLAVGVYVGFDRPRTLGHAETGSSVAAPVFGAFMRDALAGAPAAPFRIPPGMSFLRVGRMSGQPAAPGEADIILEAFKPGTEPRPGRPGPTGGGEGISGIY
ncbi:MAG: penicillin-binding protein 1A [Alphaproteobacteria bacterium]|nr:penicillin-binding protein 1A [Alphaproteobacteria bacterium]MCY4318974.1 penicillin-binding protein 1A [Alphaproteobacteria bacterium]